MDWDGDGGGAAARGCFFVIPVYGERFPPEPSATRAPFGLTLRPAAALPLPSEAERTAQGIPPPRTKRTRLPGHARRREGAARADSVGAHERNVTNDGARLTSPMNKSRQ